MRIMGRDAIAIVPAAPVRQRNNDVEHPYRQDSDFQYLTGFGEPEAVAVLVPGRAAAEYVLFVRDKDPLRETWDGRRAGPAGAVERHRRRRCLSDLRHGRDPAGADGRTASRVYYAMGTHPEFDQRVLGWLQTLRDPGAPGQASAPGDDRAGPCAARHAPVQEPGRAGPDARVGADRRRGAAARHALTASRAATSTRSPRS